MSPPGAVAVAVMRSGVSGSVVSRSKRPSSISSSSSSCSWEVSELGPQTSTHCMQPVHFHGSIVTEYSAPEPLARFSSASKIGRVRATGNDAIAATIWSSSAVGNGSSDNAEAACVATAARSPADDFATKRRRTSSDQAGTRSYHCLLYTSDAADDLLCVDLGGRRIIKKKK